jgi:hypothetical protein
VERFDKEKGNWLACGRSKENSFLARGLVDGNEYRFRISAVNKYGYSDTLENKENIMIGSDGGGAGGGGATSDDSVRNM